MESYNCIQKFSKTPGLLAASIAMALSVQSAPSFAARGFALEEVVVTARKREESLQDVPISATVFDASSLERRSATDVSDIVPSVPNMSYQDRAGGFQTSIGIRGIASNVRNAGVEDSVGVYVDGVYIGRPMFYNLDLAEVQQMEVLRGPQGTLFGKNTIAGALNITTKAIAEEFEGKVMLTAGSYGLVHAKLHMGGMLSDTIGGSVSVVSKKSDGFVDNLFNGDELQAVDQQGISAKLLFKLVDNLDITLTADSSEKDNDVNASQLLSASGGFGISTEFTNQADPFEIRENGPQKYVEDVDGYSVTAEYTFDNDYSLIFIGAHRKMDFFAAFDDDNSQLDIFYSLITDKTEQSSYELRLASPSNDNFEWLLGLFYFDQESDSHRTTIVPFAGGATIASGSVNADSTAIYFNGDYHVSENLNLNIGLRHTKDDKSADWNQESDASVQGFWPNVTAAGEESWENTSGTVSLTYLFNDDTSVYAKVSTGYKGGGFVTDYIGTGGFKLEPEEVTNYELGLKSTLLDNRLRLNAAIFQMDYTDLQTMTLNNTIFVGSNAGSATVGGLELDVQFLATENLMITGGFGYVDATVDDFVALGTDHSGNTLSNAPEVTANLLVEYKTLIGDNGGELVIIGEVSHKAKTYFNIANDDFGTAPSYELFNARVGYIGADEKWSVYVWGKNLADEEYFTYLRNGPVGQHSGLFGEPRTFGVDVTLKF